MSQDGRVRPRPSHILFDLDGTLADSSSGILWSFRATLDKIGLPADEAKLRQLIGPPLGESFGILGVEADRIDEVVAIYRAYYAERGVYQAELYGGVAATLLALSQQGVRLGVATAKRVDFARQMLATLGVAEYFDQICGATIDLQVTSKFDIMTMVLDRWTIAQRLDVWMVGDRHYDMVAARAHEVRAVGALWGLGTAQELRDAGSHWLVARPQDLLEFEVDAGSPVCFLEEICDECGRVIDALHPTSCSSLNR